MKRLQILIVTAIAAVGLSFYACTDDPKATNETTPTKMESYEILRHYLKRGDDKIVYLDITEKEAEQLGVPSEHYRSGLEDIRTANEWLQKAREDGIPITYMDLSDNHNINYTPKSNISLPGGHFSVAGNGPADEATVYFYAPFEMAG